MIRLIIKFYMVLIILDAVLSYFPQFNRQEWRMKLKKIVDISCNPVRRLLPESLPFDLSGLIVIFLLSLFIQIFSSLW